MKTMLERAEEALWIAIHKADPEAQDYEHDGKRLTKGVVDTRDAVRALVQALRQPTDEMLCAAEIGATTDYAEDALGFYEDIWQIMIDALLKEQAGS